MNMNLNWGPYLMKTTVDDYIVDWLIENGEKQNSDFRDQLAGHLKVEKAYDDEQKKWFANEMVGIFNDYRLKHNKYHRLDRIGDDKVKVKMKLDSLWINYMLKGDVNPPHTHTGDLSFVIYCQVPDNMTTDVDGIVVKQSAYPGAIIFSHGENSRPQWTTNEICHMPKKGDCFIFPATLTHLVLPFRCEGTRISVSGNLSYLNRHEWPQGFF